MSACNGNKENVASLECVTRLISAPLRHLWGCAGGNPCLAGVSDVLRRSTALCVSSLRVFLGLARLRVSGRLRTARLGPYPLLDISYGPTDTARSAVSDKKTKNGRNKWP